MDILISNGVKNAIQTCSNTTDWSNLVPCLDQHQLKIIHHPWSTIPNDLNGFFIHTDKNVLILSRFRFFEEREIEHLDFSQIHQRESPIVLFDLLVSIVARIK